MEKFKWCGFEFLIVMDVVVCGLDVDDFEVVFNFDLLNDVEDYIYCIGCIGRVGKEGWVFIFVLGCEFYKL